MTKETKNRELNVHLSQGCIADLGQLGQKLKIGAGEVLALAWELGKQALLARTPGVDEEGQEVVGLHSSPPILPEGMEVDAGRTDPPELDESGGKTLMNFALSSRALEEVEGFAFFADRSLSWCLHQVFLEARPGLWARVSPKEPDISISF